MDSTNKHGDYASSISSSTLAHSLQPPKEAAPSQPSFVDSRAKIKDASASINSTKPLPLIVERFNGLSVVGKYNGGSKRKSAVKHTDVCKYPTTTNEEVVALRKEVSSLRDRLSSVDPFFHLQDALEPADIAEEFRLINRAVQRLCGGIAAEVNKQRGIDDASTILRKIKVCPAPESKGKPGVSRDIIIEFALRSTLSQQIFNIVFNRFYPTLDSHTDKQVSDVYSAMRRKGQRLSGEWRSNFVITCGESTSYGEWESKANVMETVVGELAGVLGEVKISEELRRRLGLVLHQAYTWNHKVKSNAVHLDYHPIIDVDSETLDIADIKDVNDQVGVGPSSKSGLLAVALGLQSSQSHEGKLEFACQEKIQVVTREFFYS